MKRNRHFVGIGPEFSGISIIDGGEQKEDELFMAPR